MNVRAENEFPSFLGIQISNGDVIPIDVRYIDKTKIVFSLPPHNSKQPYTVSGSISNDVDNVLLKKTLNAFIVKFTEEEEIILQTPQPPHDQRSYAETTVKQQTIEIPQPKIIKVTNVSTMPSNQFKIPNQNIHLIDNKFKVPLPQSQVTYLKRPNPGGPDIYQDNKKDKMTTIREQEQNNYSPESSEFFNENTSETYTYDEGNRPNKIPKYPNTTQINQLSDFEAENTMESFRRPSVNYDDSNHLNRIRKVNSIYVGIEEKQRLAHDLLFSGYKLYESDHFNGEISETALKMLMQAQIIYHEIYPDSFSKIVLPGTIQRIIHNIDSDAIMMAPKQFRRFMIRRLELAELRRKGIITSRTFGIIYPSRAEQAKKRVRDKYGTFLKE